jgi:hypothetical protein
MILNAATPHQRAGRPASQRKYSAFELALPTGVIRMLLVALALLGASLAAGCRAGGSESPGQIAPTWQEWPDSLEGRAESKQVELPPEQTSSAFDFEPAGHDAEGRALYRVRIRAGGSPYLVATSRFTPLFQVDGKDAVTFVNDAYFQANPGRTPYSIQPGDQFMLALPPGTFVVRWQEERTEQLGLTARLREYVSEQGDRLLFYLTAQFPLRYELRLASTPDSALLSFSPDLPFLVQTGRVDHARLTRLIYRVDEPDLFQLEATRRLIEEMRAGSELTRQIDRSHRYLDPVRAAAEDAIATESVVEPERAHLQRFLLPPQSDWPFLAVEDGIGTSTSLSEVGDAQVLRIVYGRNGMVQVYYRTGADDARGRRDPYQLRENERWTALYRRLQPAADTPVKWGPGEPSDLEPFPTARDPLQRNRGQEPSYDYLLPGRVLVLTFQPVRYESDLLAELQFKAVLGTLRDHYREQLDGLGQMLDSLSSDLSEE